MNSVTEKALNIPPFIVMDVLERAYELEREGSHIIHLEVGEPDFPTPACICDAAVKAIQEEKTHYTHSLGLIEDYSENKGHPYQFSLKPDWQPPPTRADEGNSRCGRDAGHRFRQQR
jgi:hypothetical protein